MRDRGARWVAVLLGGVTALACAAFWVPHVLPTQDVSQHVRLADMLLAIRSHPDSPLSQTYEMALGLRTTSLFTWTCVAAHPWIDPETCARAWLSFWTALAALSAWLWVRRAYPESSGRALVWAPFLIAWPATTGLLDFVASVPCAAISVWLIARSSPRVHNALLAIPLLFLTFLGHVSSFAIAIAMICIVTLLRVRGTRRTHALYAVVATLPPLLLALSSMLADFGQPVATHTSSPLPVSVFPTPLEVLLLPVIRSRANVGPVDKVVQTIVLASILLGIVVALRRMITIRPTSEGHTFTVQRSPQARWLAALGLLMLGLAVLPIAAFGGWHLSARLVPFMLLLAPLAVAWPKPGSSVERLVVLCLGAASLVTVASIGASWRATDADLDAVKGAAPWLGRNASVLPLVFEPGPAQSFALRHMPILRHSWAVPCRIALCRVPFGFETLRHSMLRARADAKPPLPDGPDEFAASRLWNETPTDLPHVIGVFRGSLEDVTAASWTLSPWLGRPEAWSRLASGLLDQATRSVDYVLAIHPPPTALSAMRSRSWKELYNVRDVHVFQARGVSVSLP